MNTNANADEINTFQTENVCSKFFAWFTGIMCFAYSILGIVNYTTNPEQHSNIFWASLVITLSATALSATVSKQERFTFNLKNVLNMCAIAINVIETILAGIGLFVMTDGTNPVLDAFLFSLGSFQRNVLVLVTFIFLVLTTVGNILTMGVNAIAANGRHINSAALLQGEGYRNY